MEVDSESGEPQYLQLARQVRQRIIDGSLEVGEPLPSSREVLARHGVGRATWGRAVAELRRQGLVSVRRGQGAWVTARPAVRVVALGPGDRVSARAAAEGERESLGAGLLTPVLVVTRADGSREVHDGAVTVCLVTGSLCPFRARAARGGHGPCLPVAAPLSAVLQGGQVDELDVAHQLVHGLGGVPEQDLALRVPAHRLRFPDDQARRLAAQRAGRGLRAHHWSPIARALPACRARSAARARA